MVAENVSIQLPISPTAAQLTLMQNGVSSPPLSANISLSSDKKLTASTTLKATPEAGNLVPGLLTCELTLQDKDNHLHSFSSTVGLTQDQIEAFKAAPQTKVPQSGEIAEAVSEAKSTETKPEAAAPEEKHWYSLSALSPFATLLSSAAVVLGLTCLGWLLFESIRGANRATLDDLDKLANRIESLKRKQEEESRTPAQMPVPVASSTYAGDRVTSADMDALGERLKYCDQQAKNLQKRIEAQELDTGKLKSVLSRSLQQASAHRTRAAVTPAGPEYALAAIVNRWLSSGSTDTQKLEDLAGRTTIPAARLAILETKGDIQEGIAACHTSPRGAWLMYPLAGDREVLIVPVEAQQLTMGAYPFQLSKMFEGASTQDLRGNFRFEAIYRACQLRQAGDHSYEIVKRGALKLAGCAGPGTQAAPLYEDFEQAVPSARGVSAGLGDLFDEWSRKTNDALEQVRKSVEQHSRRLEGHDASAAQIEALRGTIDSSIRTIREELTRSIYAFSEQFANKGEQRQLLARVGQLESDLKNLPVDRNGISPAGKSPGADVGSGSERTHLSSPTVPAASSNAAAIAPRVDSGPAQAQSSSTSAPVSSQPQAPRRPAAAVAITPQRAAVRETPSVLWQENRNSANSTPAVAPPAGNASPQSPLNMAPPAGAEINLDDVWRRAFDIARMNPDCRPELEDLPSAADYARRLSILRGALATADPHLQAWIVHVKCKDDLRGLLTLHQVREQADQALVCTECGETTLWQFAVVFGAPAERRLRLLFPAGLLGRTHFASGFAMLIDGISTQITTFTMRPAHPAILVHAGSGDADYFVQQKLMLDLSDRGELSNA